MARDKTALQVCDPSGTQACGPARLWAPPAAAAVQVEHSAGELPSELAPVQNSVLAVVQSLYLSAVQIVDSGFVQV